jgi:hypothetical protein
VRKLSPLFPGSPPERFSASYRTQTKPRSGNSINALALLDMLYGIPLLMIISHWSVAGEPIVGLVPISRLERIAHVVESDRCIALGIARSPRTSSESGLQMLIAWKPEALKPAKLERMHLLIPDPGCRETIISSIWIIRLAKIN